MKQRTIEPATIYRRFVRQQINSISLGRDFAILNTAEESVQIDLASATVSSVPNWLVFRKVTLTTPQGSFVLSGISKDAVTEIETAIQEAQRRGKAVEVLLKQADQVQASLSTWDALAARDSYLTVSQVRRWRADAPQLLAPGNEDVDLTDRLPPSGQAKTPANDPADARRG